MRKKLILILGFFVIFLVCGGMGGGIGYTRDSAGEDVAAGKELVERIGVEEVMGPLAPVALSPFFGMTCLSGTSILSSKGMLPENSFLTDNSALNNGGVFLAFLGLTIITSIPKLSSGSKIFAEAVDQLETYAGIVSFAVVYLLADFGLDEAAKGADVVYQAGVISFTKETLLLAAALCNIFVINAVKYFFELLVLISPIPLIDAFFEAANKAFAGGLALIYAFSPGAALVIDLILFGLCLLVFGKVWRLLRYYRNILLYPVTGGFLRVRERDIRAARRFGEGAGSERMLCRVFPSRKIGHIKKKSMCYLFGRDDGFVLVGPGLFRGAKFERLARNNVEIDVEKGVFSNRLKFSEPGGKSVFSLIFSHFYDDRLDDIRSNAGG